MNINIEERVANISGNNYYFYWPSVDTGAWEGPLEDWIENIERWKKYCRNFDTVVQAGGNCGLYPKLYSEIFNTVYTFEPSWVPFYFLSLNCDKQNIIKINAAVGDTNNLVGVWDTNTGNMGTHFLNFEEFLPNGHEGHFVPKSIVPTFTIDQLNLTSCDLIHLDCEGSEYMALKGAQRTIEKYKPVIITEKGRGQELLKDYTKVYGVPEGVCDYIFVPNNF